MTIPNSVSINTSKFTVSFWLNFHYIRPDTGNTIIEKRNGVVPGVYVGNYLISYIPYASSPYTGPTLRVVIGDELNEIIAYNDNTILVENKYYFISATYDQSFLTLYLDGVQIAQVASNMTTNIGSGDINIGRDTCPGVGRYTSEIIDQLYIYNRALSEFEIQELYYNLLKGDIDRDREVNLADAILALQILIKISPSTIIGISGDVNGNNSIGLEEAIYAFQWVAGFYNHTPVLETIGNKEVDENQSLSFQAIGTDSDGDDLTYMAIDLPDGAIFNPNTRTFSWTPSYSQSGVYDVTFIVKDIYNKSDSETVTITVNDIPLFVAPEYFPLNVGNWWDYKDDNTGEIGRSYVEGNKLIGGIVTKVYLFQSGEGDKDYYTSDSNGLKLYGGYIISEYYTGDIYFDTPLLLAPNNAQVGSKHVSKTTYTITLFISGYGNFTSQVDVTYTTNVLALEDVTTELSTLKDCVKVSTQVTQYIHELNKTTTGETSYYWFSKGIGVVKVLEDGNSVTITKSYINGVNQNY